MFETAITRRAALRRGASAGAVCLVAPRTMLGTDITSNEPASKQGCTLGFSTYGMPALKVEKAIATVETIGFDAIEINVAANADASPAKLTSERRQAVRKLLDASPLRLTSLMEHLVPSENDGEHARQGERLVSVFTLASDLSSTEKPLVQTVLGGGTWDAKRNLLRDRLGDWLALANKHDQVLAIKPHRGGCMSRPSDAIWLIEQLGNPPNLRMVYDYSHYAFREMPLEETIKTALPYAAHVAVKDPVQQGQKVVFKLPGEAGTVDYAQLIRQFHRGGYRGDFNCEVSGMVWNAKDYDPIEAAQRCYTAMAKAFDESGVPRSRKES